MAAVEGLQSQVVPPESHLEPLVVEDENKNKDKRWASFWGSANPEGLDFIRTASGHLTIMVTILHFIVLCINLSEHAVTL
ncbi:hypothetical protein ACG7TL_004269 [Trametes sanguinea]